MNRLRPFVFHQPTTLDEAVRILAAERGAARPLAGGTDLVVDMKLGRARPPVVVNLKRIRGLDRIEPVDGGTRIGALVRIAAIQASAIVRERYPALWRASCTLATPPIRNLATIGGNLGRGSPAGDMAPPLIVHGALVEVEGPGGRRTVPIQDLHLGPGITCLAPGEVITAVVLPAPPPHGGSAFRKLGKRGGGWDIALVGAAAGLVLGGDGAIADARIALASVAPTPFRARAAEAALRGRPPSEEHFARAAGIAAEEARPISDVRASAAYRRSLARVLVLRTLRDAAGLALDAAVPR
ncbi:MAG: xanthine dehydrogenase family protein subunit M [Chloroflexi bacterium]|nr:xanthine dehydrogenase family protein subunit M [Chloroflexota bacterium]